MITKRIHASPWVNQILTVAQTAIPTKPITMRPVELVGSSTGTSQEEVEQCELSLQWSPPWAQSDMTISIRSEEQDGAGDSMVTADGDVRCNRLVTVR